MRIEYYPEDIAAEIVRKVGEDNGKNVAACEEALYDLKTLCENEYNHDSWRALYRMLEKLTEELQCDDILGR
mgnify:CR=1 FL=1|jgi:hypothetical protein